MELDTKLKLEPLVVDFEGRPLFKYSPPYLSDSDFFGNSRFKVISPTYVGALGQRGFLMLDTAPDGFGYWMGEELIYFPSIDFKVSPREGERCWSKEELKDGLAVVRHIFSPFKFEKEAFKDERFGSEGIYALPRAKDIVPENFGEQKVVPGNCGAIEEYFQGEIFVAQDYATGFLEGILGRVNSYVTYFPKRAESLIVPMLEECVKRVITTMDVFAEDYGLIGSKRVE